MTSSILRPRATSVKAIAKRNHQRHAALLRLQQLRAFGGRVRLAALVASVCASNAMAQVGGGTGTSDTVAARVSSTASAAQIILWSIAGILFTSAGLYTTFGIAMFNKKWSDLSNVCFAMVAGGLMTAICGWLFS